MSPAPISWSPSQYWDGDDGAWSSFSLRVGAPEQVVRVLPSTAGQATWVVIPQGCPSGQRGTEDSLTCNESRGGLYNISESKSWEGLGNYLLGLEVNLGYNETAAYGLDTIALGATNSTGGPRLEFQVVVGIATDDYYLGTFGLGHQGTNLTNLTEPHTTFLSSLTSKNLIPSLSWGYTAGAPYRLKGVFGSLIFGGYDSSRFIPNEVPFTLAPDISRDLVVGLQSIHTSNTLSDSTTSLLPSPILTFIDSTLPYIYLPVAACQEFESAFGLVWDETSEAYWVNDTLHQSLLSTNPKLTFTIGDLKMGGPTVDIVLPYASFDLEARYPSVLNNTRYFPLQRATSEDQYTLGRTFLQEAYLIANYEHLNFSISQCTFEEDVPAKIVAIQSTTLISSRMSRADIIGTAVGATVFVVLLVLTLVLLILRRMRKLSLQSENNITEPETPIEDRKTRIVCSIREIDQNSLCGPYRELADKDRAELLDEQMPSGSGKDIPEIAQEARPTLHELQTHHISIENPMIQISKKGGIFVRRQFSQKSWTSVDSSDNTPNVETVISSSPWHSSLAPDQSSISSFTVEKEILASYSRRTLDLERSLPPTPISESPQISPVIATFSHRFSAPRPLQVVLRGANRSMTAFISPKTPMSKYFSFKGMETAVPPPMSVTPISDIPLGPQVREIRTGTPF